MSVLKIKRQAKSGDVKQQQVPKSDDQSSNGDSAVESADSDVAALNEAVGGKKFEAELVWRNIFLFVVLHSCIPIGLLMAADPARRPHWQTVAFTWIAAYLSGLGITGGAHRLWSHKAYKVRPALEAVLMVLQTCAGQNSIYTWCRDHRVHHKYSETDADPHNIKRGFFFAHMGWLCCRKHPEVSAKGALIDMSDLEANPLVMFQHRNFLWMAALFTVLVPTLIPVLFWQERFWTSFVFAFMWRYLMSLHATWLVNSAAHYHGARPYDKNMEARESPWVILFGLGEGFHNYHHTFPFDYSTSEFGKYFNMTTFFIDLFASLGLAYDRRKMDKKSIKLRQLRTGEDLAPAPKLDDSEQDDSRAQAEREVARKFVSPFNMDYISGPTSVKYAL